MDIKGMPKNANGEEQDIFSKKARRMLGYKAGVAKSAKQGYNRRARKAIKNTLKNYR